MEYSDSPVAVDATERTREFIDEVVIPVERELDGHVSAQQVNTLRDEARERELYAPQMPEEYGGQGLDFRDALPIFEAAGRSLLGPLALRIGAPDEGNMHMLELAATEAQKERWLEPLVAGEISSAFSMTEPHAGGGSDPKMIKTYAEKDGDEWVINGHKWWTTNGSNADFLLVLARTDQDAHPYAGCSIILVPTETDGVGIVRDIPHVGGEVTGTTHDEILYDDVRVPVSNTIGEENEGFALAQKRLGPARLTHCMRYSGMAERALDVAKAYVSEREAFGSPISEKQGVRFEIAEAETELHAARTMVRDAADKIAAGDEARIEVAMAKTFTANVVQETIDMALQFCGGNGIAKDLPIGNFYEDVRQFRIVDGADEVHKRSIARHAFEDVDEMEIEPITRFEESVL